MKNIYCPLLVIVILFSCSRQPDLLNTTTGTPEISFDVNGNHYVYSGQAKNPNDVGVYADKTIYDPYLTEPDT